MGQKGYSADFVFIDDMDLPDNPISKVGSMSYRVTGVQQLENGDRILFNGKWSTIDTVESLTTNKMIKITFNGGKTATLKKGYRVCVHEKG